MSYYLFLYFIKGVIWSFRLFLFLSWLLNWKPSIIPNSIHVNVVRPSKRSSKFWIIFYLTFLQIICFFNHVKVPDHIQNKNGKTNEEHYDIFSLHQSNIFWLARSDLLCLKAMEAESMDGTQIPTNIPSSLFPVNQSVTEYKNDKNAKMTG